MSDIMEKILDRKDRNEAYKKVCAKKCTGGVDGMELEELDGCICENWNSIKEQIRERNYTPQPVKREEIPKANGSKRKLGLKVNAEKTRITRPGRLKYLGFGFYKDSKAKEWKCRPHNDSVQKFRRALKKLTNRSKSMAFMSRVQQLNWVIRGWINYFALSSMKTAMYGIDAHFRTRLHVIIWKQWKIDKDDQTADYLSGGDRGEAGAPPRGGSAPIQLCR